MKILVPVKQVVDHGLNLTIASQHDRSNTQGQAKIINPFCAIALEQAVRLKEQGVATEVIIVSISGDDSNEALKKALACGADRAIVIKVESESSICALDIAKLLCEVINAEAPDLILMGKQAVDYDNNQTGQMLSVLLGWPQVTAASNITMDANRLIVESETDDGIETLSFKLPGLVTVDLRLNEPRFASLPDIMRANSKPIDVLNATDFNCLGRQHLELLETYAPQRKVTLEMLSSVNDLASTIKTLALK